MEGLLRFFSSLFVHFSFTAKFAASYDTPVTQNHAMFAPAGKLKYF